MIGRYVVVITSRGTYDDPDVVFGGDTDQDAQDTADAIEAAQGVDCTIVQVGNPVPGYIERMPWEDA